MALACMVVYISPVNAKPKSLWDHLDVSNAISGVRGLNASFHGVDLSSTLQLNVNTPTARTKLAWASVATPPKGWGLDRYQTVSATIKNISADNVTVTLWVVGANGWGAVGNAIELKPNQTHQLNCDLRATYPDGTPKIDPTQVAQIRFMISQATAQSKIEITNLIAHGKAPKWVRPTGHLDLPNMVDGMPAAGKRVKYQLPIDRGSDNYAVLYLPTDWQAGRKYPVIAEYPGNIFYNAKKCWSTGRPEQCAMGYGMTAGQGGIWVSLPFVDRQQNDIVEDGFGNADDTANYAMAVIDDICKQWGGDKENLILSGFSRGAIACGYIGLRDTKIASFWKGFVACQHYDGSRWKQSTMADAIARAPRFGGQAIFQIDNKQNKYQKVVDATRTEVNWTWVKSGLGYHATKMFLDNRDSTRKLRQWFATLTAKEGSRQTIDVAHLPENIKQVDLFLLMGQSNMKGRGKVPKVQTDHPLIIQMNMADDQWYSARHPLHKKGVPDLIDGSDNAGVGPGLDFAYALMNHDAQKIVALIPVAQGGSRIDLWTQGNRKYQEAIKRAQKALADFPAGKAKIRGILWLQGESDTLVSRYQSYGQKLSAMVHDLRADLNTPNLPFIATTIGSFIKPKGKYLYVKEINDDLLRLPALVANTATIDARDLTGHIGDYMHYNTASQKIIGHRYAQAYLRLTTQKDQ